MKGLGTTKAHYVYGGRAKIVGLRCFYCHRHINLKSSESLIDRSYNGNIYCDSCYLQASNGCINEHERSQISSYWRKCKTCGKKINKKYTYCYKCNPEMTHEEKKNRVILSTRWKPDPKYPPKPKRDTTFDSARNLRKDLSFCQNIDCPDRKPMSKTDMIKVKRRAAGEIIMYFCSKDCAQSFMEKNKDFLYKTW